MMADLTEKVIDMLDDSTLEAVKVCTSLQRFFCHCIFFTAFIPLPL